MNRHRNQVFGLILIGAGRRLALATLIAIALWALYFWATSSPGAL